MNYSIGEVAQLITAIVLAATFIQNLFLGRRTTRIELGQAAIKDNVFTIEKATNSMKDALVEATRAAALAKGTAAGIVTGTAAGLAQGRDEAKK